jgi:uncharacterized protein
MKLWKQCAAVAGVAAFFGISAVGAAAWAKPSKKRQVLFFNKSSGFEHPVVKEKGGEPSHAAKVLVELGGKHGFEVTASKDGGLFTPEGLAKFDVLVFFTSGDLTKPGTDKTPPFPPGGKELLLESVGKGKGFVGLHAASDTFHSPGDRFNHDGDQTDPFIRMLGGEFIQHGVQQTARVFCANPKFPGLAACKGSFDLHEEWYSFKNMADDLHVLQWIGTWSLKNTGGDSVYRRPPYPVTWARMHGKGRVFYTALGHREDVWMHPLFQNMLAGAIRWAAGDARFSIKPTVRQLNPGFDELPPKDPKPAAPGAAPAAAASPTQRAN